MVGRDPAVEELNFALAPRPLRLQEATSSRPALYDAINGFAHGTRQYLLVSTVFGLIVAVLDTIAHAVSETLGFQTVVLNVYRPEWDDFYVETVYGSELVRNALLGQVYDWDSWKPLLDPNNLKRNENDVSFNYSQATFSNEQLAGEKTGEEKGKRKVIALVPSNDNG